MSRKLISLCRINKKDKTGKLSVPEWSINKHDCCYGEKHEYWYDEKTDSHCYRRISPPVNKPRSVTYLEDLDAQFHLDFPDYIEELDDYNGLPSKYWKNYSDDIKLTAFDMYARGIVIKKPKTEWEKEIDKLHDEFIARIAKIEEKKKEDKTKEVEKQVEKPVANERKEIMLNLYQSLSTRQQAYMDAKCKQLAVKSKLDKLDFVDVTNEQLAEMDESQMSGLMNNFVKSHGIACKNKDSKE